MSSIHTIFTCGVGRLVRPQFLGDNQWPERHRRAVRRNGCRVLYLGTQNPVGFKPYLDNVQKALDNQYLPEFRAVPGKKSGLQYVRLSTEVAGVELVSADSDWVKAK